VTGRLAGTVVVVVEGADAAETARLLSAEGATVVLAGPGREDTGRLVAELELGHGRVAVFDTAAGVDGLAEFIVEQFGLSS